MKKDEARLLHGLYYHHEVVGLTITYSEAQLNWLVNTPIHKGRTWAGENGALKSIETKGDDYLSRIGETSAVTARPLRYLHDLGYITYKKSGQDLSISVTGSGADLARELDTFWGRTNLLYKKHKDGVIWFLATVLVSLITTLIAKSTP